MAPVLPRVLLGTLVLVGALACAERAHADDDVVDSVWTPPPAKAPTTPHYLRAVLEEGGLLVVGTIQYASATANSQDWDLGYNWPGLRVKLTGEALRFDTNHFDTNMMTHPVAGTFYYIAARGNRIGVFESFLFTAAASTLWEYVGEFREVASVNDLVVTPISGMVFGEALTQLGMFFDRSKRTDVNELLGFVFAPSRSIHEALDGTADVRDAEQDALGLTRRVGHRFDLRFGVGMVDGDERRFDGRFALHTEVVDVPHYNAPGIMAESLSLSRVDVELAVVSGGLRDFQLDVLVAPLGYYAHALSRDRGVLAGQRFLFGGTVGFDYGLHAYPSTPVGGLDRIAGVHAGGVTAEYRVLGPRVRVRTALDVRPAFAAVRSGALGGYLARGRAPDAVPTVTLDEGYYFAAGAVLAPTIELGVERWTLGAQARFESYWGIQGLDRRQAQMHDEVDLRDRRTMGRVYVSYTPIDALELRITLERRTRDGDVAEVAASRSEWALVSGAGVLF